jgi:DNA-binding Xre family transcriptional regulator
MKDLKLKSAIFSNKRRELEITYSSGKTLTIHFGAIGIVKNLANVWVDNVTKGRSLGIEFMDGSVDYLPYDQPLHIAKDPEYLLQNHIVNIIAQIKEELAERKISKKYLARQLETSDNQIQRLLNPEILNKNLTQLYKLANLLGLQFELCLKAA